MSETKQLLHKIAALRVRLERTPAPDPAEPVGDAAGAALRQLEDKVRDGDRQLGRLETTVAPLERDPAPLPARLTARGTRVLKQSRELLQALRDCADDPALVDDRNDPLGAVHHEAAALLDVVLRTVQGFPPTPSVQFRLCEGLDGVLATVEGHLGVLRAGLAHRKYEQSEIDTRADFMCRLANGQPVGPGALQAQADAVLDKARAGQPLRFLSAAPSDPARFAAAHGLTVAQVFARLLLHDAEWQPRLQTALMTALVHDVGMTRVPAELLAKAGPLDDEERRLIERHTVVGGPMVAPLWPAGGWPVEAVTDHHERLDGTGYPLGRKDIQIAPFVRLLAVCDVYAALACARPQRPALDPRTALTDTLLMADHRLLDRDAAERLLALSFYPAGTVVLLDDGALACVVRSAGLTDPTRPLLQLLTGPAAGPLPLPCLLDLGTRRERSIVRGLTRDERRAALGRKYPELV